jgi:hypothetical protein
MKRKPSAGTLELVQIVEDMFYEERGDYLTEKRADLRRRYTEWRNRYLPHCLSTCPCRACHEKRQEAVDTSHSVKCSCKRCKETRCRSMSTNVQTVTEE